MSLPKDHAALVRSTIAQILLRANTIAGDRIEEERVDGVAEGDTPRIIIFAEEAAQTDSPAGTALTFDVSANLIIQALVEDADRGQVLAKADGILAQIKAAIFEAPAFTTIVSGVPSFQVTASFRKNGMLIVGDVRLQLSATWREIYNPNPTTVLSDVAVTAPVSNTATVFAQFVPGS